MRESQEYFLKILFKMAHIDVMKIDREHINMAIKMIYDDNSILDRVYSFIANIPNAELKYSLIRMLIVNYARFNGNLIDRNITYFANTDIDEALKRYNEDYRFGLDLLNSFIGFLDAGRYPFAIDENLENILKINIRYDVFMVKTIEDVLNEALVRVMKVIYERVKSPGATVGLLTSLFYGGKLMSLDINIENDIEFIQAYRDYIIKMGYARLYALEVGTDAFEFDEGFLRLFDEHIYKGNYNFDSVGYARYFVSAYIKSLAYKGDINLSDEQYSYIRSINPIYTSEGYYGR